MKTILTNNRANLYDRKPEKRITLQARVQRFQTDSIGQVLAPGAVPVADRKPYPFHLFANFDKQGAYSIADQITQRDNTFLFGMYVHGISTPLFFFNPAATINSQLKKGDIIFLYVDDLNSPNIFTFIVVSASVGSFASLISETNISQIDRNGWGAFRFENFQFTWEDDAQLKLPFYVIQHFFDGDFKFDLINPQAYRNTMQKAAIKTQTIDLQFIVNQYTGLSGYLDWTNQQVQFLFELHN